MEHGNNEVRVQPPANEPSEEETPALDAVNAVEEAVAVIHQEEGRVEMGGRAEEGPEEVGNRAAVEVVVEEAGQDQALQEAIEHRGAAAEVVILEDGDDDIQIIEPVDEYDPPRPEPTQAQRIDILETTVRRLRQIVDRNEDDIATLRRENDILRRLLRRQQNRGRIEQAPLERPPGRIGHYDEEEEERPRRRQRGQDGEAGPSSKKARNE